MDRWLSVDRLFFVVHCDTFDWATFDWATFDWAMFDPAREAKHETPPASADRDRHILPAGDLLPAGLGR